MLIYDSPITSTFYSGIILQTYSIKDTIVDDASPVIAKYVRFFETRPSSLDTFKSVLYVWEGPGHTHWCADVSGMEAISLHIRKLGTD
jgi:hypothetical protein